MLGTGRNNVSNFLGNTSSAPLTEKLHFVTLQLQLIDGHGNDAAPIPFIACVGGLLPCEALIVAFRNVALTH